MGGNKNAFISLTTLLSWKLGTFVQALFIRTVVQYLSTEYTRDKEEEHRSYSLAPQVVPFTLTRQVVILHWITKLQIVFYKWCYRVVTLLMP